MNPNYECFPSQMKESTPSARPSEFGLVFAVYLITLIGVSLTYSSGSGFVFCSVLVVVSSLLMLRKALSTRIICLVILLLSLAGMWREMVLVDSLARRILRRQNEDLRIRIQHLEQNETMPPLTVPKPTAPPLL